MKNSKQFNKTGKNLVSVNSRSKLRDNITDESIAYGYTLTIWGSGALLLLNFSVNELNLLSYIFGGLIGFAALSLVVFRHFIEKIDSKNTGKNEIVVASMIHIIASLGTVLINYVFINNVSGTLNQQMIFFITGFNATVFYNVMLLLESFISQDLYKLEKKFSKR